MVAAVDESPPWRTLKEQVGAWSRRPGAWLALAIAAGGSALVAATWLVAHHTFEARQRALEAEVSLLRGTRQVDLPRLLNDLQRLAGPAADRLALQDLKQRNAALEQEHKTTVAALEALRQSRRLEERFTLTAGSPRDVLNGKVPVLLEGVQVDGAQVSLAGAPASVWRPGDFRDLNFGGGRFRLTLEAIPKEAGGQANFRLDALVAPPGGTMAP